jgi:hypothetical protein
LLFYANESIFHTSKRSAFSVVLPAFGTVRRLAPTANDHLVHHVIATNRTAKFFDNGRLILVQKLNPFRSG